MTPIQLLSKYSLIATAMVVSMIGASSAQSFTHADSGWVKMWNGKDWSENNIFSRGYGSDSAQKYPPVSTWQILYPGTDTAAIYVSSVSQNKGNIGTKKASYSHYRMKVESKFDELGDFNAGITYHTDESAVRMSNNWPRSIEFQMRQIETGAAFSIQYVTFDTKATGNTYNPNGNKVIACASVPPCNSRSYNGSPRILNGSNGKTRWLRYELVARGSDSAIHFVNDTVVLRLSNIRIFNDVTPNKTPDRPWDHGSIGLQSEGGLIKYRHWEIMEFPAGTPKGENYLHRFFLDSPAKGSAAAIAGGSTYTIKWRTLGPIPTVNLEYGVGTAGAWQSVATGINNTGTYDWSVPASVTGPVRVRISGPAWAGADSSNATGSTAIDNGNAAKAFLNPVSFSIEGKGEVLKNIEGYSRVEIRDVFGRNVRDLAVQGESLVWDRHDAKGAKVQPGLYFLRLIGNGTGKTVQKILL